MKKKPVQTPVVVDEEVYQDILLALGHIHFQLSVIEARLVRCQRRRNPSVKKVTKK